jgi:putative phosphoesterase
MLQHVAVLCDIHSNLPALDAVLEEVRREAVERIVIGGDVLLGPMPIETLARLRDLDVAVDYIHGNCEREVLDQRRGIESKVPVGPPREAVQWTAGKLDAKQEQFIAGWPLTTRLTVDGVGDVLFCHATPRNDTEIFTIRTPEERLLPVFEGVDAALVVCGHTHMQFDRTVGRTRVVNAGSVGMAFGKPGAHWLLLGPTVELRRTEYDHAASAECIRASDYPQAEEFVTNYVLNRPTEDDVFAAWADAELK